MSDQPWTDKLLYVVMGEIGEYSDREVWGVAIFEDEPLAQQFILDATRTAAELGKRIQAFSEADPQAHHNLDVKFRDYVYGHEDKPLPEPWCTPHDANPHLWETDWHTARYHYQAVPVWTGLPNG